MPGHAYDSFEVPFAKDASNARENKIDVRCQPARILDWLPNLILPKGNQLRWHQLPSRSLRSDEARATCTFYAKFQLKRSKAEMHDAVSYSFSSHRTDRRLRLTMLRSTNFARYETNALITSNHNLFLSRLASFPDWGGGNIFCNTSTCWKIWTKYIKTRKHETLDQKFT